MRVAGEILSKMNKSVDPCTDFYTYSCGKWLTETIPPDNYGSWNAFQVGAVNLNKTGVIFLNVFIVSHFSN